MKIDKVIFAVDDNPLYADFWQIQTKLVREILNAEPVLFYITDEDSNFYFDGHGTVKKINKNNCYNTITSFQSQVIRMYATKYFPDEVCLTADIDMLMLNREYFVDQIKDIDDDSLVIFDSKSYDINRPECQDPSHHSHERYPICYNAGKGKTFDKILNTNREFVEYVDELKNLRLGWGTDEIYFGRCVNNKNHGVNIIKLIRDKTTPWISDKRIERHNFPITFSNTEEFKLNKTYGSYDVSKLINSYYIDAHCPRPYSDCKNAIDELVSQLSTNVSRIQYLYTNVDESNTYFKYKGEETEIEIILSWNGLTAYKGRMTLNSNHDTIYYIHSTNFFKNIDDYLIEVRFLDKTETLSIVINETPNNFKISHDYRTINNDVPYWTYKEIFIDKIYLSDKVKVDKGDLVVDIGSNYGFFASQAKQMGAKQIICYEPSNRLQEYLRFNLKNDNTTIIQCGVSGNDSISKFKEDFISSASGGISQNEEGYDVQIIGINRLIDSVAENIDFLKIDCEGQEIEIFNNILSNKISKVKKLVVEYHEDKTEQLISKKLLSENFIIEKIKNKIIYAYNPKLYIEPKKVALISTFCDTEEKLNILEENIVKIKNLGIDVIVISPIVIPQHIVNLCDYFFYTKDNELLKWPVRMYTHWYEMPISEGRITTLQRGLADYGWAGLHQVKKLSQIALTFDYDIFYHLIYDLEIDEVVENEFKSKNINIVHPRKDPHHPETLWETTLHFMVFERDMMEKIEKEITLKEYLGTNGMAEGEVLKWKNKFNIPTSNHPVKDKIFYWGDYDFFNYSPFPEFKLFLSKNEPITIWLGENPVYGETLPEYLRMVFYGFSNMNEIQITVNGVTNTYQPKEWEIIEFPISSQNINEIIFEYKDNTVNFTEKYNDIMMNQIYYNHRP
jgi:FkbM family methyltransferase